MTPQCETCPRYQALRDETADYARRVAITDARAAELLADSSVIQDEMDASVDRLSDPDRMPLESLTPDQELYALTAEPGEIPDLRSEVVSLAGELFASIPVLQARRHEERDDRIDRLTQTPSFCGMLGQCSLQYGELEDL